MKKGIILFVVVLLQLTTNAKAQTVNDIPISEIDVENIQIVGNS